MIALFKHILGIQRGGCIALRMVRGGVCVPMTGEVERSRKQHGEQTRTADVCQAPDREGQVIPRRCSRVTFSGHADTEDIDIDASLFIALHAVLDLRGTSDDPAEVLVDLARDCPAELLARMAAQEPDQFVETARFVVQVYQAQRDEPAPE